jgi:hypothetical protein
MHFCKLLNNVHLNRKSIIIITTKKTNTSHKIYKPLKKFPNFNLTPNKILSPPSTSSHLSSPPNYEVPKTHKPNTNVSQPSLSPTKNEISNKHKNKYIQISHSIQK